LFLYSCTKGITYITYIITYNNIILYIYVHNTYITAHRRALLQKGTVYQLFKKFPDGNCWSTTVLKSAQYWTVFWACV
jgi:hypothetical protein